MNVGVVRVARTHSGLRLFKMPSTILPPTMAVAHFQTPPGQQLPGKTCLKSESHLIQYNEAIKALNTLQSNAATIQQSKRKLARDTQSPEIEVSNTIKYLNKCGIDVDNLENKVSVIHVAGTKGKGSTCALCESILRAHGFKTGFFSSPHLINVKERIRINGEPLSYKQFTDYFWSVFNPLSNNKDNESDMPAYFRFLTVMAFRVFLTEEVDVAIIEVGIGGDRDCTNFLKKTKVVGITSLGLDHTKILGNTIEEIAFQKAGIMKPHCLAFTAPQPNEAMDVLYKTSLSRNCRLEVVPELDSYDWGQFDTSNLNLIQTLNASLAMQLANAWMQIKRQQEYCPLTKVDEVTLRGLLNVEWAGRCQRVSAGDLTIYVDGAHTLESIQLCAHWFLKSTKHKEGKRYLIFNITGDRNPQLLLPPLVECNFDKTFFCPNIVRDHQSSSQDQVELCYKDGEALEKCRRNLSAWEELVGERGPGEGQVVQSVSAAIEAIRKESAGSHVLITGSLHLVGAALSLLQPPS